MPPSCRLAPRTARLGTRLDAVRVPTSGRTTAHRDPRMVSAAAGLSTAVRGHRRCDPAPVTNSSIACSSSRSRARAHRRRSPRGLPRARLQSPLRSRTAHPMDPRNDAAPPPPDPHKAFAELSKIMLGAEPLDAVLTRIAEMAKRTIPEVAEASVTLIRDGQVSSVVFTGSLAVDLDERQYEAGFGPCVDAAASGATIAIPDTVSNSDYPDFARAARRRGINATLSVGLPVEQRTIGALNLYNSSGEPFDDASAELARAFASYAAVAVANAGVYASTQELARNLQRALTSRAIIDQAKGILMAQHRLTADDAFELLSQRSQRDNRKLRELAADIVASVQPVDVSLDVGDKL